MNNKSFTWVIKQSGVSLVELLVAMAVGLFLVSGVVTVMTQGKDKFLFEQEMALIQENARFIMDELAFEIRMAGYNGCNSELVVTNTVDFTADQEWMLGGPGIIGYESTDTLPSVMSGGIKSGTDMVVINRGEMDDSLRIYDHNKGAPANFFVEPAATHPVGTLLMMVSPNCSDSALVQKSGPSSSSSSVVVHNTGSTVSPGNCTKNVSFKGTCKNPPKSSDKGLPFPDGSSLMEYVSHAFYVKDSAVTGLPTLFKRYITVDSSGSSPSILSEEQEFLSGVEDLEITYGRSLDGDRTPEQFFSAKDIASDEWDNVVAVRMEITLMSTRPVSGEYLKKDVVVSAALRN